MTVHDAEGRAFLRAGTRLSTLVRAQEARQGVRLACVVAVALTAANCSQQTAGRSVDSKYGVAASPRVVKDGDPVPKGGGRDLIGKPYVVAGRTYVPRQNANYESEGLASWYGASFHGRLTANGEIFDRHSIAAAHTTMPLPSYARVTNTENGRSIIVRVNDRGPYHGNRIIDVSQMTAEALDFRHKGTARVRVEYVGRASLGGSDDRILLSSLRTDGQPASLSGAAPVMVAEAQRRPDVPRQALALRSYEPSPAQEVEDEVERAPAVPAARAAAPIPLPPERPYDLGTIPNAGMPVPVVGTVPGGRSVGRPVMAGLSYGPDRTVAAGLRLAQSFQPVATKDVTGLNARR